MFMYACAHAHTHTYIKSLSCLFLITSLNLSPNTIVNKRKEWWEILSFIYLKFKCQWIHFLVLYSWDRWEQLHQNFCQPNINKCNSKQYSNALPSSASLSRRGIVILLLCMNDRGKKNRCCIVSAEAGCQFYFPF